MMEGFGERLSGRFDADNKGIVRPCSGYEVPCADEDLDFAMA